MNIEEAKEILKEMNDFNTFQFCEICKCRIESATDICENKDCEYLKAIDTVLNELDNRISKDELRKYLDKRINIVREEKYKAENQIDIAIYEGIIELLKMVRQDLLNKE